MNIEAICRWVFIFLSKPFCSKFMTLFFFELVYHFWQMVQVNKLHPYCLLMVATLVFHQILLTFKVCLPCMKYAFNFNN